jgi:hypothetical protein
VRQKQATTSPGVESVDTVLNVKAEKNPFQTEIAEAIFSLRRGDSEYFGPICQAPFESNSEPVFVLDADLPGQRSLIQTLIVSYEGVLYFHASVEIDFLVVYENVNVLIHVRPRGAWRSVPALRLQGS